MVRIWENGEGTKFNKTTHEPNSQVTVVRGEGGGIVLQAVLT